VYLKLGRHGPGLASSEDPHIIVRLPKHEKKAAESAAAKQSKMRKAVPKDGAWLSAKPKAKVGKRKKASAPKKAKATKKVKTKTASRKPAASKRGTIAKTAAAKPVSENEVIEIASDDDDDDDDGEEEATELPLKSQRSSEEALWSDDDSEDEFEF
jgi:hypothetical protein